jgi:hypothetical protein
MISDMVRIYDTLTSDAKAGDVVQVDTTTFPLFLRRLLLAQYACGLTSPPVISIRLDLSNRDIDLGAWTWRTAGEVTKESFADLVELFESVFIETL